MDVERSGRPIKISTFKTQHGVSFLKHDQIYYVDNEPRKNTP